MAYDPCHTLTPFDFDDEIHFGFGPIQEHEKEPKHNHSFAMDQYGFYQQIKPQNQQEPNSNYSFFDDISDTNTIFFPTTQPTIQESVTFAEAIKQIPSQTSPPMASLELLSNYGSGLKKFNKAGKATNDVVGISKKWNYYRRQKPSTEEIIRIAGARYIQFSNVAYHDYSLPTHPFGYAHSGLSEGETEDVELVHLLLASAEKVGYQEYDRATRLLRNCELIASSKANPVQRVVFFFAEALREKINKETGRANLGSSKGLLSEIIEGSSKVNLMEIRPAEKDEIITQGLSTNITTLTYHQQVPFCQVLQFPAIQTIVENFASETRIHIIDLEIRSGIQWTGLFQALAGREGLPPVEQLKITAVGVAGAHKINETRKCLINLAKNLEIPFSFQTVIVSDMGDIKEELFEIDEEEAVGVYSSIVLRTLLWRPHCLENLMRVIRNLRPSIMVIAEVEANHNSPSFANRFIESLFFNGAFFDCIDTCIKDEDFRTRMEELLSVGIRNVVASEQSERVNRNVRLGVWRQFFSRFRMLELKLSESSMYQAKLVAKQFGCGSSCSVDTNGKSLVVGWKGTPIHSLSAWKFL
ncbi:hypothetical protein UlMin_030767 [Ulmus minor]